MWQYTRSLRQSLQAFIKSPRSKHPRDSEPALDACRFEPCIRSLPDDQDTSSIKLVQIVASDAALPKRDFGLTEFRF